ncbi:MAG: effector-associated domain EAD1-containing protein [Chloroflexota bacterium]
MQLSGAEIQRFQKALLKAYPTEEALEQMVGVTLEENLNEHVKNENLGTKVYELIKWAESQGRLDELLKGAIAQNPGNPSLQPFAQNIKSTATDTPPLLPYLVDRSQHVYEFRNALTEAVKPDLAPLICIVYGNYQQCHDKFIDRLASEEIPKIYVNLTNNQIQSQVYVHKKPLTWPDWCDTSSKLFGHLRYSLEKVLETATGNDYASITEAINRLLAEGLVLVNTLVQEEQLYAYESGLDGIKDYIKFWQNEICIQPKGRLIVCLCIRYDAKQPPSLLERLWGDRKKK